LPEEKKEPTPPKEEPKDAAKDKAAKPEEKARGETCGADEAEGEGSGRSTHLRQARQGLLFVRRVIKAKDGKETKTDFAISESIWPS